MSMMRHMLNVIMDGIKDVGMVASYAEEAHRMPDQKGAAEWFATRAKTRLGHLERDWKDVHEELEEHGHNDELVDALSCHVNHQIADLKARIDKM